MNDRLAEMFELQSKLQFQSYGRVPQRMLPGERIQYVKDMVLAATVELGEALDETQWKPWALGSNRINVDAYVGELVDAWHFLMNLLLATGLTPEAAADRLYEGYLTKRGVNERRAAEGYDAVSTKCPRCKRVLDDPAVRCNTTRIDKPPHPTVDGWCEQEQKFYYWITTVGDSGKIDRRITIVPEDQLERIVIQ